MTTKERIRLLTAERKLTRHSRFPRSGICEHCRAVLVRRVGREAAVRVISACPECGARCC
jgi:hypothetical protein